LASEPSLEEVDDASPLSPEDVLDDDWSFSSLLELEASEVEPGELESLEASDEALSVVPGVSPLPLSSPEDEDEPVSVELVTEGCEPSAAELP
jgi:hypothetical protein